MVNEGAHHLFRLNTEETSQSTKHILGRHHPRPHPGFHCYDSPNCITQYCSNCAQHCCFITVFWGRGALRPNAGHGLLIHEVSKSYTTMHHSRQDSSGRVISSSQRPLPDNTQHSQETSMPPAGFEPIISEGERSQTHALDRAATGTCNMCVCTYIYIYALFLLFLFIFLCYF